MSRPGYEACTGCHICVLPCPVWQQTHDMSLTLAGRAKALQAGARALDLVESLEACVLCGACEPVCPVEIDTVGMTLDLRRELIAEGAPTIFADAGNRGIAAAIEAGLPLDGAVLENYLKPLRGKKRIVVAEGILHRHLREWLPGVQVVGTGEALLEDKRVRAALKPTDLYIIETRAYHADFKRLAPFYDAIRVASGCQMNLDLQRAAIPTGAFALQLALGVETVSLKEQAAWILEGRKVDRVIVESRGDAVAFEKLGGINLVALEDLAGVPV